ncbi:MAG: hypothetical protein ACK4ND_12980 [Cytophagaceae bacterium]
MTTLLLSGTILTQAKAGTEGIPTPIETTIMSDKSAETESLLLRLNEINEMDKKALNSGEKRQLRREVRSIKSDLSTRNGGGIYLSAGALILIIVLLIILL